MVWNLVSWFYHNISQMICDYSVFKKGYILRVNGVNQIYIKIVLDSQRNRISQTKTFIARTKIML